MKQLTKSWITISASHHVKRFCQVILFFVKLQHIASFCSKCFLNRVFASSICFLLIRSCRWNPPFFISWFSFTNIHDSQDSRRKGEAISLIPLYHFEPLHRHLDNRRTITAESLPLHIATSSTRTKKLWFPHTFLFVSWGDKCQLIGQIFLRTKWTILLNDLRQI